MHLWSIRYLQGVLQAFREIYLKRPDGVAQCWKNRQATCASLMRMSFHLLDIGIAAYCVDFTRGSSRAHLSRKLIDADPVSQKGGLPW